MAEALLLSPAAGALPAAVPGFDGAGASSGATWLLSGLVLLCRLGGWTLDCGHIVTSYIYNIFIKTNNFIIIIVLQILFLLHVTLMSHLESLHL